MHARQDVKLKCTVSGLAPKVSKYKVSLAFNPVERIRDYQGPDGSIRLTPSFLSLSYA